MRLIKMFGLTALATAVAAGLIGVSSASATPTQLCNVHTALTCPPGQGTTLQHETLLPNTHWKLLTNIVNILCLFALKESTPLGLGNPQIVHTTELTLAECGTTGPHNNCVITVEELPLLQLLKTGLDQGVLTALNGRIRIVCENIFGFLDIDCKFDLTGMELEMGNQHSTADEVPLTPIPGSFLCPDEALLDHLLGTLVNHYILQ